MTFYYQHNKKSGKLACPFYLVKRMLILKQFNIIPPEKMRKPEVFLSFQGVWNILYVQVHTMLVTFDRNWTSVQYWLRFYKRKSLRRIEVQFRSKIKNNVGRLSCMNIPCKIFSVMNFLTIHQYLALFLLISVSPVLEIYFHQHPCIDFYFNNTNDLYLISICHKWILFRFTELH